MSYGSLIYGLGTYKGVFSSGHIGAFYFGPLDETVDVPVIEISAVLLPPEVTVINTKDSVKSPQYLSIFFKLLQPTIYATQDILVDFVGVPRAGSSPLTVDFTAIVNFSPEIKGIYKILEYQWCFDYDYINNVCRIPFVTTTQNPITHVYTGYRGQQYSVKLCVKLGLI